MSKLLLAVILTAFLSYASAARCTFFEPYTRSKILYGSKLNTLYKTTLSACQHKCNVDSMCHTIQFGPNGVCDLFPYFYDEADALEYILQHVENWTIYECREIQLCECCLRGDPELTPFDRSLGVTQIGNGNRPFVNSGTMGDGACAVESFIVADNPYVEDPGKSIIMSLTVFVDLPNHHVLNITLAHTPIIDEVPRVYVDSTVPLTFPVATTEDRIVMENDGTVSITIATCHMRLEFADFKNSETCLRMPQNLIVSPSSEAGPGLCGTCPVIQGTYL